MPPRLCIIPARALNDPNMTFKQLRALLAIGNFTQDNGEGVWASNSTLAQRAGLDERDMRRAVSELEERGYLRRQRRKRKNGADFTSLVNILLDDPALSGVGGRRGESPTLGGANHPGEEGRITPPNDKQEREAVNDSSTPTTTRARGLFANVPPGLPDAYRLAYEALRETAKNPVAYDATLGAALEGMHGKAWSAEDVGQALLDLWANGEGWNSGLFRAYLQRHARAVERNAALDAQQAANPTGQTKSPKRFRYTLTDEQRAAAIAQWEAEDRAAAEAAQAKAVANA